MVFKKDGLALRVLDKNNDWERPDYSLGYVQKNSMEKSREILSRLIGKNDFILAVDSELLVLPVNDREGIALNFLESVKKMGIDYRYKKGKTVNTILGFIRAKEMDRHYIAAIISNAKWTGGDISEILNPYGCRFYILKEGKDPVFVLNALQAGEWSNEEMNENLRMTIFDCPATGYMGIYAKQIETPEIRNLLGV